MSRCEPAVFPSDGSAAFARGFVIVRAVVVSGSSALSTVLRGALRARLFATGHVEDVALVEHEAIVDGEPRILVAYVVPRAAAERSRIAGALAEAAPSHLTHLVLVRRVPVRDDGSVDEARLATVPVLDPPALARISSALGRAPADDGDGDGARGAELASLTERREAPARVHVHALVSSPEAASASRASASQPEARGARGVTALAPAIADGGPAIAPEGAPSTLSAVLVGAARARPDAHLVYVDGDGAARRSSWPELLEEAERVSGALRALGLRPSEPIVLALERAEHVLPAFWGAILSGVRPVIVDPPRAPRGLGFERLVAAIELLDARHVVLADDAPSIAAALDDDPRPRARAARRSSIAELLRAAPDRGHHVAAPEDLAFFSLTSGSTGRAKCVSLTHRGLLARARGASAVLGASSSEVALAWLPFEHIGTISDWHLRLAELGASAVYVPRDVVLARPLAWLDLLHAYRATSSWAPDFAFRLVADALGREAHVDWELSSVRVLLSAGESVAARTTSEAVERLGRHGLRATAVHPAFGMAELGSGITYHVPSESQPIVTHTLDTGGARASFVELGPPIPGARLRIVDDARTVLSEGAIGHLEVAGDVVSLGYFGDPDATASTFHADGWFDTGDLGCLVDGRLVLTGRAKETLIIHGANHHPQEIEAAVESVVGVAPASAAAAAVRMPGSGVREGLAVFFSSTASDAPLGPLLEAVRGAVVAHTGVRPELVLTLDPTAVPRTAIGKIQRRELARRLERGVLDDELRRADLALGNERTVPDWFFVRTDEPRALDAADVDPVGGAAWLILSDGTGLAAALAGRAAGRDEPCVVVGPMLDGDGALATALEGARARFGARTLHVVSLEPHALEARASVARFLALTKALEHTRGEGSIRALVVGSASTSPGTAAVFGLARAARRELPWLELTIVERTSEAPSFDDASAALVREALAQPRTPDVVHRDRGRRVPAIARARFPRAPAPVIAAGGLYVVTGGLGGIGARLARFLVEVHDARVLVVSRTVPSASAEGALDPSQAERRRTLDALTALGRVEHAAAAVTDPRGLEEVITRAEVRAGRSIDGVFHLAGAYHDRPVLEESDESVAELLSPKVDGARTLVEVVTRRPGAWIVALSSLAGTFGGALVGAHAAASLALEAVMRDARARGVRAHVIISGPWRGLGIARGSADELLRAKGFFSARPEEGLTSLVAALSHDVPELIVGLDGAHPIVRAAVVLEPEAPVGLEHVVTSAMAEPRTIDVVDALGRPHAVVASPRPVEPPSVRAASKARAPMTATEASIAELWSSLLERTTIDVDDSFFVLGGHSILVTQLVSRLRHTFGADVPMAAIFEAPTVRGIAAAVERALATETVSPGDDGLLAELDSLSDDEVAALIAEDRAASSTAERTREGAKIRAIGLVTADRIGASERALTSYAENLLRHGRDAELRVYDDSPDPDVRAGYVEMLRRLGRRLGVSIHYAGREDKQRFARRLSELAGVSPAVVDSAVVRPPSLGYGCGANRNAMLLDGAGDALFSIDDDTICRIARSPEPAEGLAIRGGLDPSSMWFHEDLDAALRAARFEDVDLLALHEGLLGRRGLELIQQSSSISVGPGASHVEARAAAEDAHVALTVTGTLGDCGWAVPFGRWAGALGYLVLDDASHARLVKSEADYVRACTSRQFLRVVDRPTIADEANPISTFVGLDARTLLPPFLPVFRGADMVFGAMLLQMWPAGLLGHVPGALVHAPIEPRRFWPGEVVRNATGWDSTQLLIDALRAWTPPATRDPAKRLEVLGAHLAELGRRPLVDFVAFVSGESKRESRLFAERLRTHLDEHAGAPEYWQRDLERYATLLEGSLDRPERWVPLDVLVKVGDPERALATVQLVVARFGALLRAWPALFDAARELRARGEPMARPV
jgi:acyl-CoA synthetase (AMP-forming)/AMP-acid ligase II/NADP-dependent 3-hydroxy acid dehydrogenase YdfG/acyl carrier protein